MTAKSPRVVWPPPAAEPEAEPASEAEPEPASEAEPEPASEAEPEPASEVEPEPAPPPDRESTAETALISEAQLIAGAEARAELDALTKAEPEPEPEPEPAPAQAHATETEGEPDREPEPGPEPPHEAPFDYAHEPGFDREASPGVPLSDADWAWTQPASRIPTIDARVALLSAATVQPQPAQAQPPEPAAAAPAAPARQAPPEPAAPTRQAPPEPVAPTKQAPPEPAPPIPKAPAADDEAGRPSLAERSRLRRRARYLRRLREVQLRDLGGFMLELHRFGRERPDLVAAKVERAANTDRELNGLELALDGARSLRELREVGIGGACEHCGAVHGSADRFCATCGESLRPPLDDQLDDDSQ